MEKSLEIRCPKLGHQVAFHYCLMENQTLPCSRTLGCWQPYFPVADYLRDHLSPEQWDQCFQKAPEPKICSLIELIERAKARQQDRG